MYVKLRILFLYLITANFILGCNEPSKTKRRSEILPMYPYVVVDTSLVNNKQSVIRAEFYVITNASSDTIALKKQVELFNKESLKNIETQVNGLQRIFYKESKVTTPNYVETDAENILEHSKDLIVQVHWLDKGKISYFSFYKNEELIRSFKDIELK